MRDLSLLQDRIAEAETHGLDSSDEHLAKAKQLAKDLGGERIENDWIHEPMKTSLYL